MYVFIFVHIKKHISGHIYLLSNGPIHFHINYENGSLNNNYQGYYDYAKIFDMSAFTMLDTYSPEKISDSITGIFNVSRIFLTKF